MAEPDLFENPVDRTTHLQRVAATPDISAWVSANAGSGKTHVLANRVIRLLLSGVRPSTILCLTYTKAAAAEMSNRVFRILSGWTRLDDEALASEIANLEGRPASRAEFIRARQLFAMALETPGGLKIQTIHGFCEAVLHRFPLEANIAGHFNVLDDTAAANLLAQARRTLFLPDDGEAGRMVADAIESVLETAGETGLNDLLAEIYARRREIAGFLDAMQQEGDIARNLRRITGIAEGESRSDVRHHLWPIPGLTPSYLKTMQEIASGPKPKKAALEFAKSLTEAGQTNEPGLRTEKIRELFFTGTGGPRKFTHVKSKTMVAELHDIAECIDEAMDHVTATFQALKAHDALAATHAALIVAERYISAFETLKQRQAFLDFDDLIALTEALLARPGAGAWVHYKLDQGIDHILVDEAQDTAPLQWNVIGALSEEFFAGESARRGLRTLFSVGDEKQSIYSFQGARPERFAQERRRIDKQANAANLVFKEIPLTVSFRSTREVLSLVDHVFADPDSHRGMGEQAATIIHESARRQAPGRVELWDMIVAEKEIQSESWTDPFDKVPETAPAARLATRIADRLEHWIGNERIVDSKTKQSRPVRPGDILVLIRKRDGFVPTLLRMLKARGSIPVAGADRLKLTDHIAVQDLMALGRYALLADDDLSLAGLVKSPLSGLGEDELYRLAAERPDGMSVSDHLSGLSQSDPAFDRLHKMVQHWRMLAQTLSVHDFYATILGPDGGREQFIARLGSEVGDVLDEFLTLALEHDGAGVPGLQSFISMLDLEAPEIKREMEQGIDAVRVMTVHASKGLEAPIVFLVDQGGEAYLSRNAPCIWMLDDPQRPADNAVPLWLPNKELRSIDAAVDASKRHRDEGEEEYRRLLYVGLTRASDRLIVCGYSGVRRASSPTWHSMVSAGFDRAGETADIEIREEVSNDGPDTAKARILLHSREAIPVERGDESAAGPEPVLPIFQCPDTPLPPPRRMPRPLSPSGSGASLTQDHEPVAFVSPFTTGRSGPSAQMERGRAAHRLLQVLPGMAGNERRPAAERYVERALPGFDKGERSKLVTEILTILEDPEFAAIFDGQSATEVSIMGQLRIGNETRVVSGRIDRLAVFDDHVLVLDYKTGQMLADGRHHPAHATQLAIYRALLSPLYPDREIRAALVYTVVPRLVWLDAGELDAALKQLSG